MTAQLSAPAIGYRAFKWDGSGPLKSTGVTAARPITREPHRARCIATTAPMHDAPQESCTCGIYAHSTPEAIAGSVGAHGIGAVVMGYGNLIIHPDGWRAELVELVALIDRVILIEREAGKVTTPPGTPGLDLLAEEYGVRLLDRWEDAAALARELGAEPVPEILHAEAEGWQLGPEKREPLFPDGMAAHYGDIEQRIRELLPWIERHMIRSMEMLQYPAYSSPYLAGGRIASFSVPVSTEVRLSVMDPQHRAEVQITLHI